MKILFLVVFKLMFLYGVYLETGLVTVIYLFLLSIVATACVVEESKPKSERLFSGKQPKGN